MFLGSKDPSYQPKGKKFVQAVVYFVCGQLSVLLLGVWLSIPLLYLNVAIIGSYIVYLVVTKQTYMQHLKRKKQLNEATVKQYKK